MSFFKLLEKYFVPLFILAIISGILFPQFGVFSPATSFMFAAAIFLASLKVDFNLFFAHIRDFPYVAKKFLLIKIFAPLAVFFITFPFFPEFALGGLLIVALPSGMTNIIYSDIFKGNNALTLLFTVSTHLLSPITIPFLILLSSSQAIYIDYTSLFFSLVGIVLLPVIIAYLVKRKFSKNIEKISDKISGANILITAVIVLVIIATNAGKFGEWKAFALPLVYAFAIFLATTLFGLFLARRESRENKIAVSLSAFHPNTILGLFLASTYFPIAVVSISIAAELINNLYTAFYMILINKYLPIK